MIKNDRIIWKFRPATRAKKSSKIYSRKKRLPTNEVFVYDE